MRISFGLLALALVPISCGPADTAPGFAVPWTKSPDPMPTAADVSLGPNLLPNPSVETPSTGGLPAQWNKGGYGSNVQKLTYPVPGFNSPSGLETAISSYTNGDAKWYFNDVPVVSGQVYQFSDAYYANIPSTISVRFKLSDGTFSYKNILAPGPSAAYTTASAYFLTPANSVSVTVFHLISQVGTLFTDNFSLNQVLPPPDSSGNLVANPGFEVSVSPGQPWAWSQGGWGTNTAVYSYPVPGVNGNLGAKVAMTSYTNGDAKWVFNDVPVQRGVYTYSTQYLSTTTTSLSARFLNQNGSYTYQNLGSLSPSAAFLGAAVDLWVPLSAQKLTIFQLLSGVGELTIDNVSMVLKSPPKGIFTTGAVSLAFDDGFVSQYQNALPKLAAAGIKGTFYIITQTTADTGAVGYMSWAQIADLYSQGHEIGAHTRTHPYLSQLTAAQQQDQIQGSIQDLLAQNLGPVASMAYPYGDYNSSTLQIVQGTALTGAATAHPGEVIPTTNKILLPRFGVQSTTTFAQVQQAIDAAVANKDWIILEIHRVDYSGDQYATTPDTFNQIVDYIGQQGITVVTVSQGLASMQ